MKKTKILSLLLCLSLFCALIVPGTRAYADNEPDSGMKISKTAAANADGSYTIMLEAYATGAKVISEITKDVPTDIILVLDQSGSMADDIGQVQYTAYTGNNTQNKSNYEKRHNGGSANLWHKLADGSYVSVSVKKSTEYTALSASLVNYATSWGSISENCYFYYANNLYEKVGDEYKKVELSENKSGDWYNPTYTYTYTFSDGTSISSTGRDSKPNLGSYAPLYTPAADGDSTVYTYTYTDSNGAVHTIDTSTGANERFTPAFYQRSTTTSGGGSRLNALKSAATSFANQVATKANGTDGFAGTDDDVKHRIAVVGYAGSSSNLTNGFKQMNNTSQAADVSSAIDNLTANGGTHIDQGLSTANGIFANNPIGDTENRNRVVIVFTDGAPGSYGDWRSESVQTANNAIAYAKTAKKPTSEGGYGATVYTIGIFSGADASNPDSLPAYTSYTTGWLGSEQSPSEADQVKNSNRFMHLVSSNYPAASSITQPGSINPNLNGKSYYLSAGDSASLNSIFQQISSNIETGGTSSTLTADAVVKDIISPYFTLPAGTTASGIQIDTYDCTGKTGNTYTWSSTSGGSGGASATVSGDQVSVTGFNFSENWCGTETDAQGNTTVRGKKLVISFDVQPKPGFFGGNGVVTNTSAGIYENGSAQTPVMTFEQPTVDVPLAEPEVTVPDANVYLGAYYSQTVPEDAVKLGATVKIGGYDIDFSKADDPDHPYGLEPWQVEYVNISISAATTGNGGSFENIQEDISYTVTVTVSPKTPGTSGEQSTTDTGTGTIHVFKPELTFKDSDVWYGGAAPENYNGNLVEETWVNSDGTKKHDDADVTMLNTKPLLTLNYTPEAGKIDANGKINTKQDIKVKVDVTMPVGQTQTQTNVNAHTTFKHTPCTDETCGWPAPTNPGDPAFLLHVKTCTLTVSKTGGADDESYVFDVYKDGVKYSEVTVEGNTSQTLYELPIGNYTILENTGWSWRYNADNGSGAALSAANPNGSITCTNSSNGKIYWLNGFSQVVRNIFGTNH